MSDLTLIDAVATELTVAERAELGRYEAVIGRNLTGFLEASRALLAIRDGKLYRATHSTFEDYCRERWDISRSYGYRMISAAEVVENLSPIGDVLPANEAQTRPLASLEPDQQVAAWKRATEVAGGKPTAAQVQQAADEIKPRYIPIWELEGKVKEWLASETPFDTGALTMLDTMHGLRRHLYHDRLAIHLRNNAVSYRPSDLRQAINNVREQRRQEQRIAGSKAVYTGDKPEPAQATTEAEPQSKPTPTYIPPIPADPAPTEPPSDEELAAMVEVEAERVTEDGERAAREAARKEREERAWEEARQMQREAEAVFAPAEQALDPTPPDLLAAGYRIETWLHAGKWVWGRATGLLNDRQYSLPFKTAALAIDKAREDLLMRSPIHGPRPAPIDATPLAPTLPADPDTLPVPIDDIERLLRSYDGVHGHVLDARLLVRRVQRWLDSLPKNGTEK